MMNVRVPAIEQKAESNIRKWMHAETTNERLSRRDLDNHIGPYLALSRETGALGSELAKKVAEKLHWDLLDQEIVEYMEQHYGTPRCLIKRVDERHENWFNSLITSRIGGTGFSEETYTHRVSKLLLLAASHGNVVIVGRGAGFVLPRKKGISVRIIAPIDFRIQQVMRQREIGEKAALRWIVETDRDRAIYIKDHFGHNATDPHLYDLVLNIGDLSMDETTDIIVDVVGRRAEKSE